jgi:5'(3')-deoxyribonucleotidase
MKIGIDCDDVLLNYAQALVDYRNRTSSHHIKLSALNEYDLQRYLRFSTPEAYAKFLESFERSKEFKDMPVMKGSSEYISLLFEKEYELEVITSRRPPHIRKTISRLHNEFPGYFSRINFTHLNSDPTPKVRICKDRGIQIIIDDNPTIIQRCTNAGVIGIIFDRPWNRGQKYNHLPRTNTWFNIDSLISNLIYSACKKD